MDEFLEINLELRPQVKSSLKFAKIIQKIVVEKLKKINMEYQFLSKYLDKDLTPKIKLWPNQHAQYFKPGLKPKYILND